MRAMVVQEFGGPGQLAIGPRVQGAPAAGAGNLRWRSGAVVNVGSPDGRLVWHGLPEPANSEMQRLRDAAVCE